MFQETRRAHVVCHSYSFHRAGSPRPCAFGKGMDMGIPDWLNLIKDKFKDAASYSFVADQVASLQERILLRDDKIQLVQGKITDLEAERDAARAEAAAKSQQLAEAVKQLEKYRDKEKYEEIAGIAFKRGKKKGEYVDSPLCPDCHLHLRKKNLVEYECRCGYIARIRSIRIGIRAFLRLHFVALACK